MDKTKMQLDVFNFLVVLGVSIVSTSDKTLEYAVQLVERDLKIGTNQKDLPDGLHDVWMYRAAGEFISLSRDRLSLTDEFSSDASESNDDAIIANIKKVTMGDTVIDLSGSESSGSMSLSQLTEWLTHFGEEAIVRYRKMLW